MLSSMASTGQLSVVASLLLLAVAIASQATSAQTVGVCYGVRGNNLPPAGEVVDMYRSNNISRMRIYEPNSQVFEALRGTNIELLLDVRGLQKLAESPTAASEWVNTNILAYWPAVRFRNIAVRNEATFQSGVDKHILPAMRNIYTALTDVGLQDQIKVSTSVHYDVMGASSPPSSGAFNSQALPLMRPFVEFLNSTGAPLLMNVYPYFSYARDPRNIDLRYALFTAPPGVIVRDPYSGLEYQNLFDAMIDAVYAALDRVGAGSVDVVVSETGWPSANGIATTVENARTYNTNLVRHVGKGTPKKPGKAVETYIFSMFNEDQKPAGVMNNWGLFYPNKSPVYPISFGGAAAPPWTRAATPWTVRISVASVRF